MLQPKTYPQMLGKALVLEGEPFITMTDDDNPWVEGIFLIIVLGLLVALARFVGGWLYTISLPPTDAVLEAFVQGWRQMQNTLAPGAAGGAGEELIRQQWQTVAALAGIAGGWARLLVFVMVPVAFVCQWLFFGLIGHGLAKLMGGSASLNQTLGATALMVAPQMLMLLKVIPFVSVSAILIGLWSLFIVYRALQIAHELPWNRAAWAALLAPLILLLTTAAVLSTAAIIVAWM